jgi:hypothetical protein
MTQICESKPRQTPPRRRKPAPLPVLISIPKMAEGPRPFHTRIRRRRLRREVRITGYVLLAILPLSMAFASFGGDRLMPLASRLVVEQHANSARHPVIVLTPLEPVVTVQQPELCAPVSLPGYLLPADTSEESSDGGH